MCSSCPGSPARLCRERRAMWLGCVAGVVPAQAHAARSTGRRAGAANTHWCLASYVATSGTSFRQTGALPSASTPPQSTWRLSAVHLQHLTFEAHAKASQRRADAGHRATFPTDGAAFPVTGSAHLIGAPPGVALLVQRWIPCRTGRADGACSDAGCCQHSSSSLHVDTGKGRSLGKAQQRRQLSRA